MPPSRQNPDFTSRVLAVVRRIPYGRVATYGEVAAMAGRPGAARAVGNIMRTCGRPDVPCHRVIAAGGRLGGYGGSEVLKRQLLMSEGVVIHGNRVKSPSHRLRARQRTKGAVPSKEATVKTADVDLVERCRAGDVNAFATLYREQAPRLFALTRRMGGSPEEGEDLLQEVFLQAYRKLDSFKGDASIGTWLYRLALNHCLDYVRGRRAKMNKVTETLDGEASYEPVARRDTPIARIDLDRAVEQLPDGCREAFVLHDVEGFDHKEVGRLLGIAEGTSKSQVFKARMKLRAMLGRHAPE